MPFIDAARREQFQAAGLGKLCQAIRDFADENDFRPGDLAYIVYALLQAASANATHYAERSIVMHDVLEAWLTWRRIYHDPAEDAARYKNGEIL